MPDIEQARATSMTSTKHDMQHEAHLAQRRRYRSKRHQAPDLQQGALNTRMQAKIDLRARHLMHEARDVKTDARMKQILHKQTYEIWNSKHHTKEENTRTLG